ncbi:MAG: ROK family protein [Microbacteriaceae bacterium]|nr:ROK family protein [Microbacteriaceae bacterium]
MTLAIGIDIGGTGIKGAVVDVASGELVTERVKVPTPEGGEPDDIVAAVVGMIGGFGGRADGLPVGVCFPAIVRAGRTMSAANVSKSWIGLEAEHLFEAALHRDIFFVNDADAAGIAEAHYGAARDVRGLVIMTTLGTGIGSAFLYNGVLVPNTELGHLEIDGADAESRASNAAREREGLDWAQWAERLQRFYSTVEFLFSPALFVVGGGVSKAHDDFLPLLRLTTPIIPAVLRNNAGTLGAAALAADPSGFATGGD